MSLSEKIAMPTRRAFAALAAGALFAGPALAAADPAAERIEAFDATLIEMMKGGAGMGVRGRFRRLQPVIDETFDIPTMTRFAVGPAWAGFSEVEKAALIRAFARLSAASYAKNFDSYSGEKFVVDPKVETRGADKIVQVKLIQPKGAPVALTYRMRPAAGGWRIVDVYYGAISQLTTRRSDFAGPLASGGARGLLAHLETLTTRLVGQG
ncbi:MAG: ABC transporter substrate-binding protein [Caulobacteraceae bacterium]|nr:ABC transporter substrate-binding protein [Caulobacteraceae bacterium]